MNELLQELTICDYSRESVGRIYDLFRKELKTLPITEMIIKKGRIIYRVRQHETQNSFTQHFKEEHIFCRTDLKNILDYGRCNVPLSSAFYGCIRSDEIEEGYVPSIMETTDMYDKPDSTEFKEGYERYTLGMWKLTQDIRVMVIPPSGSNIQPSKISDLLLDEFESLVDSVKMSRDHKRLYMLLGREFSKNMVDMPNHHYAISALFSQIVLGANIQGIAFPSVRAYQKAFNIVLLPNFAKQSLELSRAGIIEFFKVKNHGYFRNLYYTDVEKGKPFEFTRVPENTTKSLKDIKDYYRSVGIYKDEFNKVFAGKNIHD